MVVANPKGVEPGAATQDKAQPEGALIVVALALKGCDRVVCCADPLDAHACAVDASQWHTVKGAPRCAKRLDANEQLKVAEEKEIIIDQSRRDYTSTSVRAAIAYFVLNDMARVDPMYQFSLDAYVSLFTISLDKSARSDDLQVRGRGRGRRKG